MEKGNIVKQWRPRHRGMVLAIRKDGTAAKVYIFGRMARSRGGRLTG